ncbi:hypothetical protein AciX9_2848 [Granulicella tundricola MP5ACTX9]|uniref:DUF2071 domain-containing protein n=2 Tax=Granulicella TaxID=940557 RepID=E8WYG5_GRATM|nr:hypothetical protein AciX9_2848 [Granulicella tundricola MP5ACTX9]
MAHRPYPLPTRPWRMKQRWNDLLFAHYPIPPSQMAPLIPTGLELDTFDGQAWLGVVPFWMDQVENRTIGDSTLSIPTTRIFSELNLRTYVRSPRTGLCGIYFFSLDCSSPLAVIGARTLFHLPYYFADINRTPSITIPDQTHYVSRRQLTSSNPRFEATFRPTGPVTLSTPGSLAAFLTERYCLFTTFRNCVLRGDIHHLPWPLQSAEADIRTDELPQAHNLTLPHDTPPILHFSSSLDVYIWSLQPDL